ncbi:hypothetical protein ACFWZ2_16010 [Streptomyces sp. NPDC059002]|uniref:hypothetical protein n=1 Tax=Streptomyces sp. NPDC059002 TaxID=3346690 RepID=UPI0036AB9489
MRTRLMAGAAVAALTLTLCGATTAAADNGPLVHSRNQAGVSVGSILDIGAKSVTTTGANKTTTKVNSAGVNLDADLDVDVDLVASILAGIG